LKLSNAQARSKRFCLPKTPGYAGEFKKSFSVSYNRKTPFDIIKLRSANCSEKYQKEDIRDEF